MMRVTASIDVDETPETSLQALDRYLPAGPATLKKAAAMAAIEVLKKAVLPLRSSGESGATKASFRLQGSSISVSQDFAFGIFAETNTSLQRTARSLGGLPTLGSCVASIDGDIDAIPETGQYAEDDGVEELLDAGERLILIGPQGEEGGQLTTPAESDRGFYDVFLGGIGGDLVPSEKTS